MNTSPTAGGRGGEGRRGEGRRGEGRGGEGRGGEESWYGKLERNEPSEVSKPRKKQVKRFVQNTLGSAASTRF